MKTLILFFTFILSINLPAQKLSKLEHHGIRAYNKQNYSKALNIFLKLDSLSENKSFNAYMIGMCYLSSDNKLKAIPYLETARTDKEISFVLYYYLGRAYLLAERYDEALTSFLLYADHLNQYGQIRFSKPSKITEANRIHIEKSMEDVMSFMALCHTPQSDDKASASAKGK